MKRNVTRRQAMRIGAGAAVGSTVGADALIDDAHAIPCGGLCVGAAVAGAVAGGVGAAALYELDVLGPRQTPDGLTNSALKTEVYNTARTRKSTNESTLTDNKNILSYGFRENLYSEGKIAAIESIQAGKSESQVLSDAKEKVKNQAVTVEKNLLKSWNESVRELKSIVDALDNSGLTTSNYIYWTYDTQSTEYAINGFNDPENADSNNQVTLSDGSSFGVWGLDPGSQPEHIIPENTFKGGKRPGVRVTDGNETVIVTNRDPWLSTWDDIQAEVSNALTGIDTWVTNAYDEAQAKDVNTVELLAPGDRAKLLSEQNDVPQAVADLRALNLPTPDVGTETIVEVDVPEGTVTHVGSVATGQDDLTLSTGKQYDPANLSYDVYLSYDLSRSVADWTAYQDGVDGGVLTLTAEPYKGQIVRLTTTDGETAKVGADKFSKSSGNWTYDYSAQLDNPITNIESVKLVPDVSGTNWTSKRLQDPFTITEATGPDGNRLGSINFKRDKAHNDSNYISEKEWKQRRKKYEDLIEEYKDSKKGAGGIFGSIGGPNVAQQIVDSVPGGAAGVAVGGGIAGLGILRGLFGS